MTLPAVLAQHAFNDLQAELLRIGQANPAAARKLRVEVELAARRLGARPMMGRLRTELLPAPYRFWSITRYQLLLVYNPASTPVRILRMLSTWRDLPLALEDIEKIG